MARLKHATDIQYLALEGGGGKGVAFLGAINALESLSVLPIKRKGDGENQIKGISGASAGAITALFLAMGVKAEELLKILSRPQDFNGFFDKAEPGIYRSVNAKNEAGTKSDADTGGRRAPIEETIKLINDRKEKIDPVALIDEATRNWKPIAAGIPGGIAPVAFSQLAGLALVGILSLAGGSMLRGLLAKNKDDPIAAALGKDINGYIYNLIYDRGLFPGFAVRNYFVRSIEAFLGSRLARQGILSKAVNFEQFYAVTGVDLIITGANITQNTPLNFSHTLTPKFPVAEAVGISMNLPVLFKPVWLDVQVPTNKRFPSPDRYKGFWVDGGLLNNLPIHAFDDAGPAKPTDLDPDIYPLNPNMLGIRLTDGFKHPPKNAAASEEKPPGTFDNFFKYLAAIMGTVLSPSEQGQIRTISEQEQTIDLYTDLLQTTEFAPSSDKRAGPIKQAEEDVLAYFK